MGNFSSQETNNIVNEFINQVNDTVAKVSNSSIVICSGTQSLTVDYCPTFTCGGGTCNNNFSQDFNGTCSVNTQNFTSISATFNNEIKNTIDNFVDQQAAQSNGWLATGFNVAGEYINNTSDLKEQLQNLFNADIKDVCQADIAALQQGILRPCGYFPNGTTFNFSQNIGETALVFCINKNIINSFQNNSTLNNFVNKTDQVISQRNAGLLDFLKVAIIAFAVVSIIGAIAYYYFSSSSRPRQEEYGRSPYGRGGGAEYGPVRNEMTSGVF